jgi:hypothetical protein
MKTKPKRFVSAMAVQELRSQGHSIAEAQTILAQHSAPASNYGEVEIHATLDLCQLAGVSIEAASALIKKKTPIARVSEALLATAAHAADRLEIGTIISNPTPRADLTEWKALQARVKTQMGIGRR